MDWSLLGIAPTNDKKEITAAYRAQLSRVNPEDHPEEFKALRAAYEEALQLVGQAENAPARDESPVGLWMERVRALYDNFSARIHAENWKELLSDDVCVALDTRPLAEDALMRFFMETYYIPQSVWQLLDETFSLTERKSELYEAYPRDFVDYVVLNGIRYPASLPYELFTPGENAADCDAYRRLYYRANQSSSEELSSLLEEMDALSERHPYGDVLRYRLMTENGQAEEARAGCRALAERYPDDANIVMARVNQCLAEESWSEAEALTRHVLELNPSHRRAKRILAESLAQQGHYHDAKELIYDLMDDAGGDQKELYSLSEILKKWNEALIGQREARMAEAPDDEENLRELGWCYLQNDRHDDALRICEQLSGEADDPYGYHNLCAKVYYAKEQADKALEHFLAGEAILRAMQPDGTHKTEKRIQKLPEYLQMEGICLTVLKRSDEASEKYEQALALAPDDPEILTNIGRYFFSQKNYERAAGLFGHLTEVMPSSYHGYFLLSSALFELRRDRDAFDAVNRALDLDGSDLFVYILKMRILLRNGVWEEVHEILDFLHKNGVKDEINSDWCEAQLVEFEEKNNEKALALYRALAERVEKGEEMDCAADLYFRIVVLAAGDRDCREESVQNELLEILEKGLSHNPEHYDCLDYKAWLLKTARENEKAIELYHKLEKMPRRTLGVERELAELYYRDLSRSADKALHYYQMLRDHEETGELCFYTGTCRRYLGDYAGAEQDFLREQALDPDDIDGYKGLSFVYEYMGQYEKALDQLETMLAMLGDSEADQSSHYYRRVRLLRRLGRPQEALDAAEDLVENSKDHAPQYQLKFDICCQFALWEQARAILKVWKRYGKDHAAQAYAAIRLELFAGNLSKARTQFFLTSSKLEETDRESAAIDIADLDGDGRHLFKYWEKKLQNDTDDTRNLLNLAEVHFFYGKREDGQKLAEKALGLLDELILDNKRNEPLYRTRRAMALAILDRMDEAREELERARSMHLCEMCDYGSCKDSYIYEARFAELSGDHEKAMALCLDGAERWPDELDFAVGINRLRRRGL